MNAYCDICESPMTMNGEKGVSVFFQCTKCEQNWSIMGLDMVTCSILKHLWPPMDKNSKMFREEYLPELLKEKKHRATMFFVGGFWSEDEMNTFIEEWKEAYDKWFIENPKENPIKHFLSRIFG